MTSWIRRPPDQPDRRWHLQGLLPSTETFLVAACGLRWQASRSYALERLDDPKELPGPPRCEACEATYRRQRV